MSGATSAEGAAPVTSVEAAVQGATPSTSSVAAAASAPTPWFLYFMIVLLALLAVLIALYCVALNDPNFPSRRHRGPNTIPNAPKPMTSAAALVKPVTGAAALPHEIPFEMHRLTLPKPSKLAHPSLQTDVHADQTNLGPPIQNQTLDETVPPATLPGGAQTTANLVRSFVRNPFGSYLGSMMQNPLSIGMSILRNKTQKTPSQQNLHGSIQSSDGQIQPIQPIHAPSVQGGSYSIAPGSVVFKPGPYVARVHWATDSCEIEGMNFAQESQVVFSRDGRHIAGDCQLTSEGTLRCRIPDRRLLGLVSNNDGSSDNLAELAGIKTLVTNPDSQTAELSADGPSYYISFAPPGVPRRLGVGASIDVRVGLYMGGVLELDPISPVSIWLEVLQEEDSESDHGSVSSRDRYDPIVLAETWAEIDQKGLAQFPNVIFPNSGKFTIRASAVQRQVNAAANVRKIIAPIVESLPIIVR